VAVDKNMRFKIKRKKNVLCLELEHAKKI